MDLGDWLRSLGLERYEDASIRVIVQFMTYGAQRRGHGPRLLAGRLYSARSRHRIPPRSNFFRLKNSVPFLTELPAGISRSHFQGSDRAVGGLGSTGYLTHSFSRTFFDWEDRHGSC